MTSRHAKEQPKPPEHLEPATREWWAQIVRDYDLESHHLRILTVAATSWDQAQNAREILRREGLVFTTKAGEPKRHPAVQVGNDAEICFMRAIRELALDISAPDDSRPPAIGRR